MVLKHNKFENVEILLWYKPPEPRKKKKKLLLYMKYWLSNSLIGILKNGVVYEQIPRISSPTLHQPGGFLSIAHLIIPFKPPNPVRLHPKWKV